VKLDAIVFDFDGVLVESVDVKTKAFAALYRDYGDALVEKVVDYHLIHGGLSRFDKFRYFHRNFLGIELMPEDEQALGDQFAGLVEEAVVASSWVPGALEFLENYHLRLPLYVASGTPDEELKRIVARRGVADCFREVFGSPKKKGEILRRIIAEGNFDPQRVLMVGDAMTDLDGAREASTLFLGRVPKGARNPFPNEVQTCPDLKFLDSLL
jgi:phosphoglycolate phosphatase-like HAD superfamily hydrolase